MDTFFIPVVLGTARSERRSENVARFVHRFITAQEGVTSELVDVEEHAPAVTTPPWGEGGADETPTAWKHIAERADGFIIVTPEYNHGYPGGLKLLLDSLYDEYAHKPVGICGVSAGGLGGARVVEHIKPVLIEFKMVPLKRAAYFSKVKEMFNDDGSMKEDHALGQEKQIAGLWEEMRFYARALKAARGGNP